VAALDKALVRAATSTVTSASTARDSLRPRAVTRTFVARPSPGDATPSTSPRFSARSTKPLRLDFS